MKKIIVRNKIARKSVITSNFIKLTADYDFKSINEMTEKYGIKYLMKKLFDEDVHVDKLEDSLVYKMYDQILREGKENDYFKTVYKVDDEFCVSLNENIHLYHLVSTIEVGNQTIIPWNYVDSKLYIGDTWWENDEAILRDLKFISIVDFIKKYKAY